MEAEKRRPPPTLVSLCIDSASSGGRTVETWRRQRRTLERLPPHLVDSLLRHLRQRRLLYPSLLEVFQRCVEEVDLRGEGGVNAEWMAYLGGFRYLRALNLADCRGLNNDSLWSISGSGSLKELDLSRCSKVTDKGIEHVLSITDLEKLFVSETGVTADGVKRLSKLTKLRALDLGGLPVTDQALSSLQVLAGLEHLDMWGSEISNNGAAILEMFPRLSFLSLAWTKVTVLPYLPSVRCLNMSNCTIHAMFDSGMSAKVPLSKLTITGATITNPDEVFINVEASNMTYLDISASPLSNFGFLVNMKCLEHLDLSSSRMSDDSIKHIAHVGGKLQHLNLSKTKITSQGISILVAHVPNLETLTLSYTEIDDLSLSYIGSIFSLRELDLSCTKLKGFFPWDRDNLNKMSSLIELQNLGLLETLNLEGTLVRDEAIYPLAFFAKLKHLYLSSESLSDIALDSLSSPLPNLETLGFRGAVLTKSGLLSYRPPPMLHLLDLRGCWLLAADAISSFCARHRQIVVRHEHVPASDTTSGSASSAVSGTTLTLRSRQKGTKQLGMPNFIDERIKYSRDELLELQFLNVSDLTTQELDMLPTILRKDSDP